MAPDSRTTVKEFSIIRTSKMKLQHCTNSEKAVEMGKAVEKIVKNGSDPASINVCSYSRALNVLHVHITLISLYISDLSKIQ